MTNIVKRLRDDILGAVPRNRRFWGPHYMPLDQSYYVERSEIRLARLALDAGVSPAMP